MGGDESTITQVFKSFNEVNFILIAIIVVGSWLSIVMIERVFPSVADRAPARFRLHIRRLVPVLRLLILIAAITQIVSQVINPTSQNLFALLGAAGLAIGFAFKDYVSSLIAGVVAIYERPYRPGDWIEIDSAYGEVKSIGLRTVNIVTPDDTAVSIPHAKIWNSNVFNSNSGQATQQCVADYYLHPKHDATLVRRKLIDVALTSPYIQINRPIAVVLSERPWGTHYRLKAYPVDSRNQFQFTSDLTARGKAAFVKLGIELTLEPAAVSSAG